VPKWCWFRKAVIQSSPPTGITFITENALAGSARSMAAADDSDYAWVRDGWGEKGPRVPLATKDMELTY